MAHPSPDNATFQALVFQQAHLFDMQRELAAQGMAYVAGEVARIFATTPHLDRFEATFEYEWMPQGDQQHRKCLPFVRVGFARDASDSLVLTEYLSRVQADNPHDLEDMELQFWSILDESGVLDHFGKALDTGSSTARFAATRDAFKQFCLEEPDHPAAAAIATCT